MQGDSVIEWESAEDRQIEVPPGPAAAVHVRCEGAATALTVEEARSDRQEEIELVAERSALLKERHSEVGFYVVYSVLQ